MHSPNPRAGGAGCQGCTATDQGIGASGGGFDLMANPNSNVGLDPEGALVLERGAAGGVALIWIANTEAGTVSKIDTRTYTELGRYEVAVNWNKEGDDNGPSRTSVDSEGSVYAGARYGDFVTKVSAAGSACGDTNGDGMVTTSTSPDDVLPLGQDDCVRWQTDIGGDARGVAVQETPAQFIIEPVLDGEAKITEIPGSRFVWAGGQEKPAMLHKLDAETGAIVFSIVPPARVYGLALDGRDNLWISARGDDAIGRVDTTRCVDGSCANEPVCVTTCSDTSCPSACDSAVVERIELATGGSPYGITVDCDQRVWVGGAHGGEGVRRYDPLAPANERLKLVPVPGEDDDGVHGIAADAKGWVWGAARDEGVWRIHADDLTFSHVPGTGGGDFSAKGMAVDRDGLVWAVPLRKEYAIVITPGQAPGDETVAKPIDGFDGPYTYSDMSGEQRRLAANDPGTYRTVFEGCAHGETDWRSLDYEVETPAATLVIFRARSADTIAELENAEWFDLGSAPGSRAPLPLQAAITPAGQASGRYLELMVLLFTDADDSTSKGGCSVSQGVSPRVLSFGLSKACAAGPL
jgi:streptogramin lyase